VSLLVTRLPNETWRQAVERYGNRYHMAGEALDAFDQEIASGVEEGQAAWNALYEWDLLDSSNGGEPTHD
jgi:hypothetical protein